MNSIKNARKKKKKKTKKVVLVNGQPVEVPDGTQVATRKVTKIKIIKKQ